MVVDPGKALQRNLIHEARRLEALLGRLEVPRTAMRRLDAEALAESARGLDPLVVEGERLQRERRDLLRAHGGNPLASGDDALRAVASTVARLTEDVERAVRGLFLLGRFQRGTVDAILAGLGADGDASGRRRGVLLDREV